MNARAIYFDMDGTIANLYGVEGWLDSLIKEHTKPYREAKSLIDMRKLSKELRRLQKEGYTIGIVSWLSKSGTDEYNRKVETAKLNWLARHLGSVEWDEIHIVKYGTPKSTVVNFPSGILFDDERPNRAEWNKATDLGCAFDVDNILTILEKMR